MIPDNDREAFKDAIREDIRQEILNSTSRGNRYAEQIAQIHREEEERKRLSRNRGRRTDRRARDIEEETSSPRRRTRDIEEETDNSRRRIRKTIEEAGQNSKKASRASDRVDNRRLKDSTDKDAQYIMEAMEKKDFIKKYLIFCGILVTLSVAFLTYVWRSIKLYEATRPEYLIAQELDSIQAGESVDNIIFPDLEENPFSSVEEMKDSYIETLQKGNLTYRFAKEDYQTGNREYMIYDAEEPVARMTLETIKTEKRLGILPITRMQIKAIEPIMNILVWDYDIQVFDSYHVYINDVEVPPSYLSGEAVSIPEFEYLYEYVDMPKVVTYHVDNIYKEAVISIRDEAGNEVDYITEGNLLYASMDSVPKTEEIPADILTEIDPLQAAKTWSLFTTRDLGGANYGLEQVRAYFINQSYYWQKLGEYARGIDITLVSDHNPTATFFTDELVSDCRMWKEDCFSCRVSFEKHMKLNVGKEQVDKTDSIFYFVRVDDTEDGLDNPTWKIADIQAVVNQ